MLSAREDGIILYELRCKYLAMHYLYMASYMASYVAKNFCLNCISIAIASFLICDKIAIYLKGMHLQ